jgi:2-polyprenyl-3-methyl-5-hydroxy-6-metoxy-1,4-benzoquinol methylase
MEKEQELAVEKAEEQMEVEDQDEEEVSDDGDESRLAKKEYWETYFSMELKNYDEIEDDGVVWFGEDVQEKVQDYFVDSKLMNYIIDYVSSNPKVLDVGCGNSAFLFSLADSGFTNLYGKDYSADAIELSKKKSIHRA